MADSKVGMGVFGAILLLVGGGYVASQMSSGASVSTLPVVQPSGAHRPKATTKEGNEGQTVTIKIRFRLTESQRSEYDAYVARGKMGGPVREASINHNKVEMPQPQYVEGVLGLGKDHGWYVSEQTVAVDKAKYVFVSAAFNGSFAAPLGCSIKVDQAVVVAKEQKSSPSVRCIWPPRTS